MRASERRKTLSLSSLSKFINDSLLFAMVSLSLARSPFFAALSLVFPS